MLALLLTSGVGEGTLVQTSPLGFSFLLSNGHNYSADVTGLWRE